MSGTIITRIPKRMHEVLTYMADKEGTSVNSLVIQSIELHPRYFYYRVQLEVEEGRAKNEQDNS